MIKKGQCKVSSTVKPNAKMDTILQGINKDRDLSTNDVIVIVGGTNNIDDTGRCNNFTTELVSFLAEVSKPKILLVGLPPRHDNPSLNPTVSKINKELSAISKSYKNVSFTPFEPQSRQSFTSHGLHLNLTGKFSLANLLLKALNIKPNPIVQSNRKSKPPIRSTPKIQPQPKNKIHHVSPPSSNSSFDRTFFNKNFLGEARKPPGVPWTLYLGGLSA